MKYMGSKSRISDQIVPIIQKYINENKVLEYVEPFVGGANIIDKIKCETKKGYDKQKYLIALLQNIDKVKSLPEFITKEHYSEVRDSFNKKQDVYEDWYIGAVGFLSSYNGRFFDGGYSGKVVTKSGKIRNYYDEAKRNVEQQTDSLANIDFKYGDYQDIRGLKNCVIYCDPPYINTKQYGVSQKFNHVEFWDWVRKMSKDNFVLVSENVAPDDFEVIWEQDILRSIDNTKRVKSSEKLFIMKKVDNE